MINSQSIALTFITQYPRWYQGKLQSIKHTDKIRGDLALESLHHAIEAGYQIIVVDGKSTKTFRRQLALLPQVHVIKRKSWKRSPARRQAFSYAARLPNVHVIVYCEAEKVNFVTHHIEQTVKPILEKKADIVIPKREPKLFVQTYPKYQFESEVEGNKLYNAQLKLQGLLPKDSEDFDHFFGPRAFKNDKRILSLFLKKVKFGLDTVEMEGLSFDPEELSNSIFFPIVLALKRGYTVTSVEVRFSYPKVQKENENFGAREYFEEKRRYQRMGLLLELMHFLQVIKKKK